MDLGKSRLRSWRMRIANVAGHQKAAVRVVAHPARQSGRLFLSLKQDQIREHPIAEYALGACLYVRPLDAFALLGGPSWRLFLQRTNRREESLSLTRRKGFDVIKKFGGVHEQYEYLIRHD